MQTDCRSLFSLTECAFLTVRNSIWQWQTGWYLMATKMLAMSMSILMTAGQPPSVMTVVVFRQILCAFQVELKHLLTMYGSFHDAFILHFTLLNVISVQNIKRLAQKHTSSHFRIYAQIMLDIIFNVKNINR